MHFVCKLDNLENSSITKGFQFFKHIWTQYFFCIQYAPFKATSSLFNPFLTSFAIFHAFHDLFWDKMTLKLKNTANELWNGWKLTWYHHFTHIACATKLRGLRQKLDALHVQIEPSPLKYQGFGRKSSVTKAFHFFKLISTPDFLCNQYAPY